MVRDLEAIAAVDDSPSNLKELEKENTLTYHMIQPWNKMELFPCALRVKDWRDLYQDLMHRW